MILDILEGGDLCSLALVVLLLLWLGNSFSESHEQRSALVPAGLVFLGYALYAWHNRPPAAANDLLALTLRALAAAGLAYGLAGIAFPLWRSIVAPLRDRIAKQRAAAKARLDEVRRQRQLDADRAAATAARTHTTRDQERLRLQRDAQAQSAADAQRRRDDARVAAEILYALHQHDLAARFTAEMFAEFCKKYMGDDRAPDYVEERSRQLQAIIQELVDKSQPARPPATLADLDQWFQEQKAILDRSGLSDVDKKVKLLHLQKRFDDLFTRVVHGA